MASMEPTAQNHNGEDNFDSFFNQQSSSEEPTTDCELLSPAYSSESEDVYILDPEDEKDNLPDPRLETIDRQFNLKIKELFTQASSGQVVPYTVEAILQQTTDEMLQYLAKSHSLTWVSYVKTTPEEDKLSL